MAAQDHCEGPEHPKAPIGTRFYLQRLAALRYSILATVPTANSRGQKYAAIAPKNVRQAIGEIKADHKAGGKDDAGGSGVSFRAVNAPTTKCFIQSFTKTKAKVAPLQNASFSHTKSNQ